MRLLLDACLSGGAAKDLRAAGHDVVWVGDWDHDPGDQEILSVAHTEGRILVTQDKDFGELAVLRGQPHSGILRLVDFRATEQARVCRQVLLSNAEVLEAGAIVTVDPGRLRIRPREDDAR